MATPQLNPRRWNPLLFASAALCRAPRTLRIYSCFWLIAYGLWLPSYLNGFLAISFQITTYNLIQNTPLHPPAKSITSKKRGEGEYPTNKHYSLSILFSALSVSLR